MGHFNKIHILLLLFILGVSCKDQRKQQNTHKDIVGQRQNIKYAKGFEITQFNGYKTITLKNPWPGSSKTFTYALIEKNGQIPDHDNYAAVVHVPVKRVVVTSTTHIPSLEMLDEIETLIGFPNLDYISSPKTRQLIAEGKVSELGRNEDLNTEILLELNPDAVIGFAVDGNNSAFATLQKTGIPVLYNADWTETSPLGKAEWIKFFGALYNKEQQADSIFKAIETEYISAKKIASEAGTKPTVISGAMYKDVWYVPQGDSWGAQFIKDANGNYLWKDSNGTGSLSLSLESVLKKGHDADYWIGPGQFTSLREIENAHSAYARFTAFKKGQVYSYSAKKGETGGVIYFELAPNRPDLVLKDHIKILHPTLLPDYQLFFFEQLQ